MKADDMKTITDAIQKLPKNHPVTLNELFPPDVWKNKPSGERKALGREFFNMVVNDEFPGFLPVGKLKDNRLQYMQF